MWSVMRIIRWQVFISSSIKKVLTKIGQYPSIADLSVAELKKYQKVLQADDYRELSRAIGLASHGIGNRFFCLPSTNL